MSEILVFCWDCLCFGYYVNATSRDIVNGFGDKEGKDSGLVEYVCYDCGSHNLVATRVCKWNLDEETRQKIVKCLQDTYAAWDGDYFNPIPVILLFMAAMDKIDLEKDVPVGTNKWDVQVRETLPKEEILQKIKDVMYDDAERIREAVGSTKNCPELREIVSEVIEKFRKDLFVGILGK